MGRYAERNEVYIIEQKAEPAITLKPLEVERSLKIV